MNRKEKTNKILKIFHFKRIIKAIKLFKEKGLKGVKLRLDTILNQENFDKNYSEWFLRNTPNDEELEKQRRYEFEFKPKISIIVPVYNTPELFLEQMLDSVIAQTYNNWELCISDGSVENKKSEKIIKKYALYDDRIKYVILYENKGISGNTNAALGIATGEYIGLLDHDDILAPNALFEVVAAIQKEKFDVIYTDEDKVTFDLSKHISPNFKPDFSIDLLRSHNYITHFFVAEKKLVEKVGNFNSEYDGAQDYDLILRCIEKAKNIKHIPKVLYHWRLSFGSTAENPESKLYAYEAGKKAVESHLNRCGIKARVETTDSWGIYHTVYETAENPLVSIVIPNKDHINDLDLCIKSIIEKSIYKNYEIIVVENNSENKETFDYYKSIEEKYKFLHVIYWNGEFNYSVINNFGVKNSKGEYILLLNNDTELISANGIGEMLGCCMRDEVGVVGARLLYKDDTIQHAGVIIGFGGFAGHIFSGLERKNHGYMARAGINCNYSAVTAACLMTSRKIYNEVEGLTESFAVALNDVDFCLKVREKKYLIVYNAFSEWYHYESKSRGYEDTTAKIERFNDEIKRFKERWKDVLEEGDPYYNINFPIELPPFTLN